MTVPERPFKIVDPAAPRHRKLKPELLALLVSFGAFLAFELAVRYRLAPVRPSWITLSPWLVCVCVFGLYCGTRYVSGLDVRYDRATRRLTTGRLMVDIVYLGFLGLWVLSGFVVPEICDSSGLPSDKLPQEDRLRWCFGVGSAIRLTAVAFVSGVTLPILRWAVQTERRDGGGVLLPATRWNMWPVWTAAGFAFLLYIIGSILYRLFSL